ncbi:aldo/keto reductase [Microlunatus sp. Gsoil 973]|uniref:aldo/keto reductase n=1 Tax=Microlunatus sp. Gsoil 973 TaxID=2672569 RepID=UPI0012B4A348|nr:aldo/keto reductase [Microlunatus sp. Gsoil 973]QGN34519.1 aldo/keto reductase [Microlunatus sp. Gsoil 973]
MPALAQRFLGRSGLQISELVLGTMSFGNQTDEPTAHTILDEFAAAGGTFIDTADTYQFGGSEEIIGRWLTRQDRDRFVIGTKAYGEMSAGAPVNGAGRKHLIRAVDASLRRLGTDYIDLFQIHLFDDATPMQETLSTLDVLVRNGKVRFVGASNYAGWQLQKSIDLARHHGWEPFVALQPLYNLLRRDAEYELLPICRNEGLGVLCWSPLEGGWLSGRYTREMTTPPAGSRYATQPEAWQQQATEATWSVVDALQSIADEVGRSPAQVALRWLLQTPGVTAPIIGARTVDQLRDNLQTADWSLSEDQVAQLTKISERPAPYPYDLLGLPQFRRRP